MQRDYEIVLEGTSPLLMHNDNLVFSETVAEWRKDPDNKEHSIAGDDRTPPWTWIGYLYHDGRHLGVSSDNVMTMIREGAAKVKVKGNLTYKKQSQAGILMGDQQLLLTIGDDKNVEIDDIRPLIGNLKFHEHIDAAEDLGFELFVRRAKIGRAKHVRVRPMFRDWKLSGNLTVLDEEKSGLTEAVINRILEQAGAFCGLCDWRPSSPSSGTYGKFIAHVKQL